jgi:hypothetical protein
LAGDCVGGALIRDNAGNVTSKENPVRYTQGPAGPQFGAVTLPNATGGRTAARLASGTEARERYLGALAAMLRWLESRSIPHVVAGSLACAAHTGLEPSFSRPAAFDPTQRCPDIDVLVPRSVIPDVSRYARAARKAPFPVKVDISCAACYIDLRPSQETSYLTHRHLARLVPSRLFVPRPTRLGETVIPVLDPRVLMHTFGVFGGIIRRKDTAKITALQNALGTGLAASVFTEADCAVFPLYLADRNRKYPMFPVVRRAADCVLETIPDGAANAAKHYLLPAVNTTRARLNQPAPASRTAAGC